MGDSQLQNAASSASWDARRVANHTQSAEIKKLAKAVEELADAVEAFAARQR